MSQQEDLLFCKIAIQSGLVTQENARKCLAYADKLEAQGKTRPRIGAVLVKANLLTQQHASRIYQAVAKRSGAKGIALREHPAAARAHAARAERARPARKPLDPRVLWIGIGSGVVLLVAVLFMSIMLLNTARDQRPAETAGSPKSAAASNTLTPEQMRQRLGTAGSAPAPQEVPVDSETRREFETQHKFALREARSYRQDSWATAIGYLEKFKEQQTHRYKLFADFHKEIDDLIAEIRQEMKAEVDAAVKEARDAVAAGDRDGARSKLEWLGDRVDPATKDQLKEQLAEILAQGQEETQGKGQ